jgi:hypothetical protein
VVALLGVLVVYKGNDALQVLQFEYHVQFIRSLDYCGSRIACNVSCERTGLW